MLGLHMTSNIKERPKLLSLSGMRGGEFISVNNFSAQQHASSKNRHMLNFRVKAVCDDKAMCSSHNTYLSWEY